MSYTWLGVAVPYMEGGQLCLMWVYMHVVIRYFSRFGNGPLQTIHNIIYIYNSNDIWVHISLH